MSGLKDGVLRYLAFRDLREASTSDLASDLAPALAVTFLSVPSGIAYALIAGVPPALGLYAAAVPAIVGGLFRSSNHVVTGPTNALSLLIGTLTASQTAADPLTFVTTLTVMTGLIQLLGGYLRLGSVVDYISTPVVTGYITGAGTLIIIGQLANATGSPGARGDVWTQLRAWVAGLGDTQPLTLAITVATVALLLGLGRFVPRVPGALTVMLLGIGLSFAFDLSAYGVATVYDVSPVPMGLPPLTTPDWQLMRQLGSAAFACTVLSFVESSSVGRAIARETGERLDMSTELAGQGLANLLGGFAGAFVTSGSLTRSALNHRAGAKTRLSGVYSGLLMLGVLLVLGPIVNLTPIAVLAGLLLTVAVRLIDLERIRHILAVRWSDAAAFVVTVGATWTLPLDQAIEVGIALSLVSFLRRARLIEPQELSPDVEGRLLAAPIGSAPGAKGSPIRFVQFSGAMFFGSAGELRDALDGLADDPGTRVLILRLKHTQRRDYSSAEVIASLSRRMKERDQTLLMAGMDASALNTLKKSGVVAELGDNQLFLSD
ncbi:MAG: SulP family inorganic anion transporter, partial [Myxococcota bacterium]